MGSGYSSQDQQDQQNKNREGIDTLARSNNTNEYSAPENGRHLYPTKDLAEMSRSLGKLNRTRYVDPPPDPLVPPPQYQVPTIRDRLPKKPLPPPKRSDLALLQKFFGLSEPLDVIEARSLACLRNKDGLTPLHEAARAGKAAECVALLRLGASLEGVDPWGYTAAHKGAAANSVEVLKTLNSFGANFEPGGIHSYLPLHRAAANGCVEAVKWLVERCGPGAVDRKAHGGWTALHLAAWWGQTEVTIALLDLGANDKALTDDGSDALKIANEQGYTEIVSVIAVFRNM